MVCSEVQNPLWRERCQAHLRRDVDGRTLGRPASVNDLRNCSRSTCSWDRVLLGVLLGGADKAQQAWAPLGLRPHVAHRSGFGGPRRERRVDGPRIYHADVYGRVVDREVCRSSHDFPVL